MTSRSRGARSTWVWMLLVGALVGACTAPASTEAPVDAEPPATTVDADVYGGFPVDPPAPDEVVLTLVGRGRSS
jgi:hypothetical protein